MSATYLSIATLLYFLTAVDLLRNKDYGMCLTFAAYAMANIGLIWAIYTRRQ